MTRVILATFLYAVTARGVFGYLGALEICHDDFNLTPRDGILPRNTFPWLGFVQYIHISTGTPNQFIAPRVLLIQKQFVLATASDIIRPPKSFKLGNVVFGEYERDEKECGLTQSQIQLGVKCAPASIEIPIVDIVPHPEFSRFGVGNSVALAKLLRPLKSNYMTPVCMPSLSERRRMNLVKKVFMVDYLNSVPQDFDLERMGKKSLRLYTQQDCKEHRLKSRLGSEGVTHFFCTTGCGVRPGAPIISHGLDGAFELFGIAVGGTSCQSGAMRRRLTKEPPLFIDVFPYLTWIRNVVTANELPTAYPQNLRQLQGGSSLVFRAPEEVLRVRHKQRQGWKGRTFLAGNYCFKSGATQLRVLRQFYMERFEVIVPPPAKLSVHMMLITEILCPIMCARLLLPLRINGDPEIKGIGAYNITINFSTDSFPINFIYSLSLSGRNVTRNEYLTWMMEFQPDFK